MGWVQIGMEKPVLDEHGNRPEKDDEGVPRDTEHVAYPRFKDLEFDVDDMATTEDRRYLEITIQNLQSSGKALSPLKAIDFENTFTEDARSTCNQNPEAGRCGDDWGIQRLEITPTWKEYFVKWADLKQQSIDWGQAHFEGFDKKRVFAAYFAVHGKGRDVKTPPFEFCVSQIYFTQ